MKATARFLGGSMAIESPQNEITPPEALRRVERGADGSMVSGLLHLRKYPWTPAALGPPELGFVAPWGPTRQALLASATMNGATASGLRPTQARNAQRVLSGLGVLWDAPALADIGVVANPRLSRTLGRLVGRPLRIEIGPRALGTSKRLREVVTHEGAHAVLVTGRANARQAPHGTEWRRLMALAGYPDARAAHWRCRPSASKSTSPTRRPKADALPATRYDHWCPVCQSSRVARRPVKAWRCAACAEAGLDGSLEITRRTARPAPAR